MYIYHWVEKNNNQDANSLQAKLLKEAWSEQLSTKMQDYSLFFIVPSFSKHFNLC